MIIAFLILAAIVVAGGLGVVLLRNVFHAAISMALAFLGVAGIYLLLGAEFLAAIQVLVYVGAIAVVLVFAIMLTPPAIGHTNLPNSQRLLAGVVALVVFGVMAGLLRRFDWPAPQAGASGGVTEIGALMVSRYLIPFQAAGAILLVALIGAITIAKGALKK